MHKYLATIVIAAKDPPLTPLILCLASFGALKYARKIQLILVESGKVPELSPNTLESFANVKRIVVPAEGVYAAYNSGITAAEGEYTLFFGVDDIALPCMDCILEELENSKEPYQLFAAACYMQSTGIRRPSSRRTSLIFANWCHQGIFYQSKYLRSNQYDLRYRIQADHKLNIDIVSNPKLKIGTSKKLVAYFSAGGLSSNSPDLTFRRNFPSIVATAYGRHWGWVVRAKQIVIDLLLGPPEARFKSHPKN